MESIKLNQLNFSFKINGSEKRRSLEIVNVAVEKKPDQSPVLTLVVLDEKDVPIYSQRLSNQGQGNSNTDVHQRFVFYEHLTVRIASEPEGSTFSAEVHFI